MTSAGAPHLVTPLPGPKGRAVVERSDRFVSPSLPRAYPLVVERAHGVFVEDVDGNRFLDCAAGIAVCSTGHCHPRVVEAIQRQAERLLHICGADFYDTRYIDLAERLSRLAPGEGPKRVFLGNSGAEAVEAALKLARHHTGRPYVVSFFGAFHGRTMGAVSLTASKPVYHQGFGPLLPGVIHVPYAYCYRCPYNLAYPECDLACVDAIEDLWLHKSVPPEEVAAIFVEPVQGEGGYIVPPDGWLAKLHALCDKYGILLVADEVQSGIGRTGRMFAVEHWGVEPDILCTAKALASGMPLSAMIAREEVMTWPPGAHGSTYGGNPVACAAAQATLDVVLEEGLMENAARVGGLLLERLRELATESHLIGDVRGLGLMIGVELVKDKATKEPAKKEAEAVVQGCFRRGLLLLTCGPNSIRFSPPLILTEAQAETAFQIFADALAEVEGG
ncbi:MAG TPA: acetyl ornithine aminotransferase family protein [Anaerolineae bacterium]|nr:acetyl ornithine aminotransferase family protein [Anaerolineae bacterium]